MIRIIVYYSGHVQGVGFRYAACRVAAGLDVTGYARNLPDGRVECVVEGPADQVEAFCDALAGQMGDFIRGVVRQEAPTTGEFQAFGIRR